MDREPPFMKSWAHRAMDAVSEKLAELGREFDIDEWERQYYRIRRVQNWLIDRLFRPAPKTKQ